MAARSNGLIVRIVFSVWVLLFCQIGSAQELELAGIGIYTEFGEANMVVRMDALDSSWNFAELDPSQQTRSLSIRFLQEKTVRRWSQFWRQNLSLNNPIDSLTDNIDDLLTVSDILQSDLMAGDLIEITQQSDDETVLKLNSIELARFENPDFYNFLLTAFTGIVPPSTTLKQQLLGLDRSDYDDDLEVFNSISYDQSRIDLIATWIPVLPDPLEDLEAAEESAEIEAGTEAEQVAEATEEIDQSEGIIEPPETQATTQIEAAVEEGLASDATEQPAVEATEAIESLDDSVESEAENIDPEEIALQAELERQRLAAEEAERQAALAEIAAAQAYLSSAMNSVYSTVVYPRTAIRRGREGIVRLSVTINRDGSLESVQVLETSKLSLLDNAAIEGVENAAPFEPIPAAVREDQSVLEFPIMFSLSNN